MEPLIFVIFFSIIIITLVLGMTIPIFKRHNEVTGGIINYDFNMRKFVYKVNLSSEDIINLLKVKNAVDELSCSFDFNRSVIKFAEYGANREYYFQVRECNGFSILRLEQVELVGTSSHIPYKLNPFIVSKLQAEIIPYSKYGF